MRNFVLILSTSILMTNMIATSIDAQQFRIETEVSQAGQIASQNLTLFSSGYVHDFMTTKADKSPAEEPETIVVWDRQRQEMTLLDVQREIKATLSHEDIIGFNAELKAREVLRKREPFLFDPKFESSFDDVGNTLTLSSDRMTYQVTGDSPDDKVALDAYHEFADWYARLNAVDPGKIPPFARLVLNRGIREHAMIPEKVELAFRPTGNHSAIKLSSRHNVNWRTSQNDRNRIATANELKTQFREASLNEYHGVR